MADEDKLVTLFRQLGNADRATLTAFAEFLASGRTPVARVAPQPVVVAEPEMIERPEKESIVAALKRLSKTYPMLDKSEMLSATSDLVARHIMQGTNAVDVIDRLEAIFSERYDTLKNPGAGQSS